MRPRRRREVFQLGAPGGRLGRARRRPGAADAVQHAVLHVRAQDGPLPPRQRDTVRDKLLYDVYTSISDKYASETESEVHTRRHLHEEIILLQQKVLI